MYRFTGPMSCETRTTSLSTCLHIRIRIRMSCERKLPVQVFTLLSLCLPPTTHADDSTIRDEEKHQTLQTTSRTANFCRLSFSAVQTTTELNFQRQPSRLPSMRQTWRYLLIDEIISEPLNSRRIEHLPPAPQNDSDCHKAIESAIPYATPKCKTLSWTMLVS